MMKEFSFYEQSGILIPGAAFLLGLLVLAPDLRPYFEQGGITVGSLGIFVLAAYITGHGVAAFGNAVETLWWHARGGIPSSWVIGESPRFLQDRQIQLLQSQIARRLNIPGIKLRTIDRSAWASIFNQIHRDVLANNPGRVEIFNGNYGLNRGLGSAFIALAFLFAATPPHRATVALALLAVAVAFLIRMQRFGIYFAKEVLSGFLNLRNGHTEGHQKTAAGDDITG